MVLVADVPEVSVVVPLVSVVMVSVAMVSVAMVSVAIVSVVTLVSPAARGVTFSVDVDPQ